MLRRHRLLIVGCGDVGLRFLRQNQRLIQAGRLRVFVLTSSAVRIPALRALGAVPLLGNLDDATSLQRLRGLAERVLYLAPPPAHTAAAAPQHCYQKMSYSGRFFGLNRQKHVENSLLDPRSLALQRSLRRGHIQKWLG